MDLIITLLQINWRDRRGRGIILEITVLSRWTFKYYASLEWLAAAAAGRADFEAAAFEAIARV